MAVDKDELEKLIQKSGVGGKTAKKLRDANENRPASPGHGAPAPVIRPRGRL